MDVHVGDLIFIVILDQIVLVKIIRGSKDNLFVVPLSHQKFGGDYIKIKRDAFFPLLSLNDN